MEAGGERGDDFGPGADVDGDDVARRIGVRVLPSRLTATRCKISQLNEDV